VRFCYDQRNWKPSILKRSGIAGRSDNMEHLRNLIIGVGDVLSAFGTAPKYRYPSPGDRTADMRNIAGDIKRVGFDMKKAATKALREEQGGKVDYGTTQG
jgi:hypothetical protein